MSVYYVSGGPIKRVLCVSDVDMTNYLLTAMLNFTTLLADSADEKLIFSSFFFSEKTDLDIFCKCCCPGEYIRRLF